MTINIAMYSFQRKKIIIDCYEVTRETEKCYFVEFFERFNVKYRFFKEDIGKVKMLALDSCPCIKLIMIDATEEELKEKIAGWFEQKANAIRNYKCE